MNTKRYQTIIIGAGTSGSYLASRLHQQGQRVLVLEKSRGLGGRCSRRGIHLDGQGFNCDLGAMAIDPLSAGAPQIAELYEQLQQQQLLQPWQVKQACFNQPTALQQKAYLLPPSNLNQLHKHWMQGIELNRNTRVGFCRHQHGKWYVYDDNEKLIANAQRLICTAPAQQSLKLLDWPQAWHSTITRAAHTCRPQWVAVVRCKSTLAADVYQGGHAVLQRAHREDRKPGRVSKEAVWVLQSDFDWAQKHQGFDAQTAAGLLLKAFAEKFKLTLKQLELLSCQRWLLGQNSTQTNTTGALWDAQQQLGISADWLASGDISGALLSSQLLTEQLNLES